MQQLDARNLQCPFPVLRANRVLATLPAGSLLEVLATGRASRSTSRSTASATATASGSTARPPASTGCSSNGARVRRSGRA